MKSGFAPDHRPEDIITTTMKGLKELGLGGWKKSETATYLRGVPWTIEVERRKDTNKLGFYVRCNEHDKTEWSCEATITLKVLPIKPGVTNKKFEFGPRKFNNKEYGWGTHDIMQMSWDEAMNSDTGYITDDGQMTFQAVISADPVIRTS